MTVAKVRDESDIDGRMIGMRRGGMSYLDIATQLGMPEDEARARVSAVFRRHYESYLYDSTPDPTAFEITTRCAEIQSEWTPEEERRRRGCGYTGRWMPPGSERSPNGILAEVIRFGGGSK